MVLFKGTIGGVKNPSVHNLYPGSELLGYT